MSRSPLRKIYDILMLLTTNGKEGRVLEADEGTRRERYALGRTI